MKICKNCGASIDDEAMFCTQCGVKTEALDEPVQEDIQNVETVKAEDTVENQKEPEIEESKSQEADAEGNAFIYGQQPNMNQENYNQQNYNQQNYNQQNYNQGNYNQGAYGGYQQQYYTQPSPYDHTAEFSAKDVSDNKVIAMMLYLTSFLGVFVALLASPDSPYLKFHVRQAIKFIVVDTLAGLIGVVLCFTFIVPVLAGIFVFVMWICKIITFFSICGGKSVEPVIIRNMGFLR